MLRRQLIPLAFLAIFLGCGHGSDYVLPPLHPAKGQVVRNRNAVKGGSVSFHRVNEQNPLIVNALVDDTGHFELASLDGRKRIPGAPAGQYQVIYSPPVLGKDSLPVTLSKTVEITAGPNELVIDLDAAE